MERILKEKQSRTRYKIMKNSRFVAAAMSVKFALSESVESASSSAPPTATPSAAPARTVWPVSGCRTREVLSESVPKALATIPLASEAGSKCGSVVGASGVFGVGETVCVVLLGACCLVVTVASGRSVVTASRGLVSVAVTGRRSGASLFLVVGLSGLVSGRFRFYKPNKNQRHEQYRVQACNLI